MRIVARAGAVLVGVLVAAAAAFWWSRSTFDGPRNLIVISIDTLRPDHLGCYGYEKETSPAIDVMARQGTVFLDASATSPWTKPSHASLFTGLYPSRHGAVATLRELLEDVPHLASWLADRGFYTTAVVNSDWLKIHGMNRGFGAFKKVRHKQGQQAPSPVTEEAIQALEARDRSRRLFAFIHYFDVHADYRAVPRFASLFPEEYLGGPRGRTEEFEEIELGLRAIEPKHIPYILSRYDAGIRQVDDQIAQLFAYLEREGLLRNSLVVLLSDHGEEFLEHGGVHHSHTQYEEVIRIPLILYGPGVPAGERVTTPASLIDVMPTALSLLGVEAPPSLDGIDLRGTWDETIPEPEERVLFFESDCLFPTMEGGFLKPGFKRAIRDARFKYHYDMKTQESMLFDLAEDAMETTDVREDHPDVVRTLGSRLAAYLERGEDAGPVGEFTDEEIERLRSLGYVN